MDPDYKEDQSSESEDDGKFLQWNHQQRRMSIQVNQLRPSDVDIKQQPSQSNNGDDNDKSTDDFSDSTSDEEIVEEEENENQSSLTVRITNIDCILPPNILEISSSFLPTFQLGLVKESKKSVFLYGAKPKMMRTVIASSHVTNQVEEIRWDDLGKSCNENMFLGVEMRIWGWFPELLRSYDEKVDELFIEEDQQQHIQHSSKDNFSSLDISWQDKLSHNRDKKKIPPIRLCSLLIPIETIEEGISVEKSYNLDFKVAGGTRKMRQMVENILYRVDPPIVTLKLEMYITPSLQELNSSEDNLHMKKIKSLQSFILRDDKDSTAMDEDKTAHDVAKFNARSNAIVASELSPGIIDFICLVAPRDIDKLKTHDNSQKGWLPTYLKYNVVEQFPSQTFYKKIGKNQELMDEVGWWCFPEGCQAWRGPKPPSAEDMKLPSRNSNDNFPNSSFFSTSPIGSTKAFDECFNCTTTLTWFVLQSKSDEVGSRTVKNHGICLRFYVPTTSSNETQDVLWIPSVLCVMTTLPIVGVIEAILLRICQTLCNRFPQSLSIQKCFKTKIYKDLANLIINYPSPVQGVLHCSMPFLKGDRLNVRLPPQTGLPPLPHGGSVTAVCRLLGAEGFTVLLAAFLTECKILLHSHDISNLTMVAEVLYALIYPFQFVFTYIPVLPEQKLEIIEAPGVWILGVSSKVMSWVDDYYLNDVVVVDLDNGFHTADYFDGRTRAYKLPSPLPAAICSSIHESVARLLRKEDMLEEEYRRECYPSEFRLLPRLENESLAEREFRVDLAIQICSLLRGYQDCLLSIGEGQPLFIHDKFLRYAPALFEEYASSSLAMPNSTSPREKPQTQTTMQKTLSPRSKRFLSLLVRTQNFQSLLESLEMDELNFFREIMDTFDWDEEGDLRSDGLSRKTLERRINHLCAYLDKIEGSIPTFHIDQRYFDKCLFETLKAKDNESNAEYQDEKNAEELDDIDRFFYNSSANSDDDIDAFDIFEQALAQKYDFSTEFSRGKCLVALDKDIWHQRIFPTKDEYEEIEGMINKQSSKVWCVCPKIPLRVAIGEERYKAYYLAQHINDEESNDDEYGNDGNESVCESVDTRNTHQSIEEDRLDLKILLALAKRGITLDEASKAINQCLSNVYAANSDELLQNAEEVLRSPSTYMDSQLFLLRVLSQRNYVGSPGTITKGSTVGAKLTWTTFKTIIRLCSSMLDVCLERRLYENAYRLLSNTNVFFCAKSTTGLINMTTTISVHPIFADLRLWEKVLVLHLKDQHSQSASTSNISDSYNVSLRKLSFAEDNLTHFYNNNSKQGASQQQTSVTKTESEYDAAVTTLYEMLGYGVPAEELARFATRLSDARNWFATELGKNIVVLAKMIGLRREEIATVSTSDDSESEFAEGPVEGVTSDYYGGKISKYLNLIETYHPSRGEASDDFLVKHGVLSLSPEKKFLTRWKELAWFHPTSTESSSNQLGDITLSQHSDVTLPEGYVGRTPITSIANFSSHFCIATGGLDGSVFFAHTLSFGSHSRRPSVRGVQLEWDSSCSPHTNTDTKQPYLSKTVSCIASSVPAQHYKPSSDHPDEILRSLEGCFIIAGSLSGNLNIWNVYDIYNSNVVASSNMDSGGGGQNKTIPRNVSVAELSDASNSSTEPTKKDDSALRGKALRGHEKGVLCIDVPSTIYRPDTVATGGADGKIKLWSLRNTSASSSSHHRAIVSKPGIPALSSSHTTETASGADSCVSVLSGHSGKVLCLRTYWHGDQIISGGSDKTVRLWDLTTSSSNTSDRCLQTFTCHSGDVTHVHYRGSDIIVSASTDRTIAISDARVGVLPVHVLRYHRSHISDLLLGSRSDNTMISASGDGTIAVWDWRSFQSSQLKKQQDLNDIKILRSPITIMSHATSSSKSVSGSISLSRGILSDNTIFSASIDGIVKEWNALSGACIGEMHTGHSGAVTCLSSYSERRSSHYDPYRLDASFYGNVSTALEDSSFGNDVYGGLITCGFDGSIRFRKCNELL